MYQTVFGQWCISPVGATFATWGRVVARAVFRTGMWSLGANSARSRHTTRGPVREAPPGLDPVNERSERGLPIEDGNGADSQLLISPQKLPWDIPGTPVLQRVPLSSVHRQPRLWSCAGSGRRSGSVGGLSGRNAGDPASDVLHNPPCLITSNQRVRREPIGM